MPTIPNVIDIAGYGPPTSNIGVVGAFYYNLVDGTKWGPKTSSGWGYMRQVLNVNNDVPLPSGIAGLWLFNQQITTGGAKVIPNQITNTTTPAVAGLMPAPRSQFDNVTYYSGAGQVNAVQGTDYALITLQVGEYIRLQAGNWTAGNYTTVVEVQRPAGVDQNINVGWNSGGNSAVVAGAAFTRVPVTKTLGAASDFLIITNPSGVNPVSFRLRSWQTYAGNADLEPGGITLAGHLNLTRYPFDSAPVLNANNADMSAANAFGTVQWLNSNAPSYSGLTYVVIAERIADNTFNTFMSWYNHYTTYRLGEGQPGNYAQYNSTLGGRSTACTAQGPTNSTYNNAVGLGPRAMWGTIDSAGNVMSGINKAKLYSGPSGAPSTNAPELWLINATNNSGFTSAYKYYGIALVPTNWDYATIQQMSDYISQNVVVTRNDVARTLVVVGDSLLVQTNNYVNDAGPIIAKNVLMINAGFPGNGISNIYNNLSYYLDIVANKQPDEKYGALIALGTNGLSPAYVSIFGHGTGNAAWLADYNDLCDMFKAGGYDYVINSTILPVIPALKPTFNADRAIVIPGIIAAVPAHAQYTNPLAANANMGNDADALNAAKYYDGEHETSPLGAGYLTTTTVTTLNSLPW